MKKALMYASVSSMIDLFNRNNINTLKNLGYEVQVACNFEEGNITSPERIEEFKKYLQNNNIIYYNIPIPRSPKKINEIKQSYNMTRDLIKKNNYDLVHCHSPIGSVICRLAFKNENSQVIYTAHGFHFFKGAPLKNWLIFFPIEKYLAKYTDILITINYEDYKRALNFPKVGKVELINGIGVNLKKFKKNTTVARNDLLSELSITDDDIVMVSVGQLSLRKNHSWVIKNLPIDKYPNIKYIILGEGELHQQLNKQIQSLGLQENVFLLGYRDNVNDYLSVSDIYIFPSLQEGLPASLMEAMSVGLPCVVAKIRGNSDLVDNEKGGYVIKLKDDKLLQSSIIKLAESREVRNQMGLYNQERILNYSESSINKRMLRIYS